MAYDPGSVPSVATLVSDLSWLDKVGNPVDLARRARAVMLAAESSDEVLAALNRLFETHGVEEVYQHPGSPRPGIGFRYLNVGDPYVATIIRFRGRWMVGSYGDLIESLERRGAKFGNAETSLAEAEIAEVNRLWRLKPSER